MSGFEVFVSYSRHDEPIVVPVVKLLRLNQHGLVFLDVDNIKPGDLWRDKLDDALKGAKYVVLFWCEHASSSDEVQREYEAALARGKRLVPVLLDRTPLPESLRAFQWIDLTPLAAAMHSPVRRDPTAHSESDAGIAPPVVSRDLVTVPQTRPVINLVVVSFRGAPVGRTMSAQFAPAGGSIGRASTNTLVLDDPDRTVSRVHAQLQCRDGSFFIVDRGTNPLQHNGQALGYGRETALSSGDRLVIGNFELMVQSAAAAAAHGPLDDFFDLGVPAPGQAPIAAAHSPVAPAVLQPVRDACTDEALLAAFLRGVGSTQQMPEALTPELMERIGALLRGATEGTLQLLLARQELKRELRAELTVIAAQANNPFKFSPTAEVALAHLLGLGVRGFMGPEAAMRDAYDDLRAHEFGVMVGMRAALAHVISRFTPEELEKKIAANRKAGLWDQFVALYSGIAAEAEDDFHSLFGKAFLKAYEEQMARLKPPDDPLRRPNTAASDDPLAALLSAPKPMAEPRAGHMPITQFGYVPPPATIDDAAAQLLAELLLRAKRDGVM